MSITQHNAELISVVEDLKGKRIIKKDTDIADKTGYSKPVISNYLSGRVKASGKFIGKFEEVFNVKIFENLVSNSKAKDGIDVYDVGSRAGIVTVYDDDNNGGQPIGQLPKEMFPGCNHAEIVRGDSMHPIVRNGALVVGKIFDKSLIINGDMYLVHTTNGLHVINKPP